jgi:hypothetical protein
MVDVLLTTLKKLSGAGFHWLLGELGAQACGEGVNLYGADI